MPTPHLSARPGDFAPTVLLPGDPLRARHVAEHWLEDPREVNHVRNALAFTGRHRDLEVSVLGTGMGIPSLSIYATELVREYGVTRLVRVGSCGAVRGELGLHDLVLAAGACTDSGVNRARYAGLDFAAVADFGLLRAAVEVAEAAGEVVHVGNVHSADLFYDPRDHLRAVMERMGVLAVEMETAGLYGLAAEHSVRALALLTVSDHLGTGAHLPADERQTGFDRMIGLALEAVHLDAGRSPAG